MPLGMALFVGLKGTVFCYFVLQLPLWGTPTLCICVLLKKGSWGLKISFKIIFLLLFCCNFLMTHSLKGDIQSKMSPQTNIISDLLLSYQDELFL